MPSDVSRLTCGVFEPCFAADDFVVEPDVRSCRERELYVAVHIVLRLLLGDLDGRATHSEMARDFLDVRLFWVFELGGAGKPVAGARALLLGVNKPSQEGLYQHFRTVSEHSPLPVILYNIPGRSGVNMTAETTLRCAADFRNVIGIKEASGDIGQMQRILDNRPEGFLVLSGDDGMAIELMRRGGDGVLSVAANAFPQRFMECVNHAKAGDFDAAEKAYAALDEAVHALFEEGNPVGVKCALSVMGRIGDTMRLPLVAGSEKLRAKFEELIARYDLR